MPYLLFQQPPFQTDFIHAVNMGLLWYAFQKQTEIGTMLTYELLSTLSFAIHGNHLFFKHLNIQKPSSQIANLAVPQQTYCGNWVSWVLDKGSDPYVLGRWSFITLHGKGNKQVTIITAYLFVFSISEFYLNNNFSSQIILLICHFVFHLACTETKLDLPFKPTSHSISSTLAMYNGVNALWYIRRYNAGSVTVVIISFSSAVPTVDNNLPNAIHQFLWASLISIILSIHCSGQQWCRAVDYIPQLWHHCFIFHQNFTT